MPVQHGMITRTHIKGDAPSTAVYSDCERYRYSLARIWQPDQPQINFVMLNPSKATEAVNDPTIERCERRARMLGFGGLVVTNLFAWRETDPARLRRAKRPVGPDNDEVLAEAARQSETVLAAWGVHGAHLDRAGQVKELLLSTGTKLTTLGVTKHGHPRHPLYVSYSQKPVPWATLP